VGDQAHIIVVDDEAELREMLEEFLTRRGFAVTTADGGAALRHAMQGRPVDLVLLDINMPGEDGLSLARWLRQETRTAIIMLTAVSDVVDRIVGLEVGADDYLTKPFDLRELLARIKSVLRRASPSPGQPSVPPPPTSPAAPAPDKLPIGRRFLLDLPSRRLFTADGTQVPLSSMEFELLRALMTHPNKVLNRDQILDLAHGRQWDPFDRSIDVRITRIRRKIESDPARPRFIRTIRGAGYMFVPDGE
jgi:two-component system, OmpR family, phosphate regulon response regulator OmpR